MADAESTTLSHRRRIVVASGVAFAVLVAIAIAFYVSTRDSDHGAEASDSATRALARLDANDGRAYVGRFDDVDDPVRLRRAVRAEFRSDDERKARGSPTRARRCAAELQATPAGARGKVVLLADGTLDGAPAVVVGITDLGRVVVFVADAGTCGIRSAQSL